jgi:hypothetical protein
MKSIRSGAIAICMLSLFAANSYAQQRMAPAGFGTGAGRPALSPYLNLANNGDPAINYYGLVRPQIAYGQAISNLNTDVNSLQAQQSVQTSALKDLPPQTGHVSSFMTQGRYFMTNGMASGTTARNSSAEAPSSPGRR